jgi:hypothetical protein
MSEEFIDECWFTCPLCGFRLHKANGRYNHMMKHVRKGEATKHSDPIATAAIRLSIWWHPPYRFKRVTP